MNNTDRDLTKIRKQSSRLSFFLVAGVSGMLFSLGEHSNVWAVYIFMTGWIGFVLGALGGPGLSDHLLGRTPPHRQSTKTQRFMWGIATFWFPCLAMIFLSIVVATTLPDATRPQSSIDGTGPNIIWQSCAMYFNAIGAAWLCVWNDVKKLAESESIASI